MSSSSLKGNVPLRLRGHTRTHVKDEGQARRRRGRSPPDVDDDAHGPHVQGAVVAFVPQHLRGQVGRRAHHGTPEGLLPDDASEAKVAEFDLRTGTRARGGRKLSPDRTVPANNLTCGKESADASSTFSGFRSQWTMFLKWR